MICDVACIYLIWKRVKEMHIDTGHSNDNVSRELILDKDSRIYVDVTRLYVLPLREMCTNIIFTAKSASWVV